VLNIRGICNLDLNIRDVSIVYVNKEYKPELEIDVQKYFIIKSVFDKVNELQPYVEKQLQAETEVLQQAEIPNIRKGDHCVTPYRCDFMEYCWKLPPGSSQIGYDTEE